jgi:hypothetical protein
MKYQRLSLSVRFGEDSAMTPYAKDLIAKARNGSPQHVSPKAA